MSPAIHFVAKDGFGIGTNEHYDKLSAISHIRARTNPSESLNVVEFGSGTGIFTRALLAHPEWSSSVNELKAFEPSEGMRQVFNDKTKDSRVSCAEGYFDHAPVDDQWADIIIVAQAFHWCLDYEKAAQEFNRILKPNGTLSFIWNLEDRDAAKWVARIRDRIERYELGTPQFRLGLWRKLYDTPSFINYFNPAEEKIWEYALIGSEEIVTNRALSKSYIAILSDSEKASVVEDIKQYLKEGEGKVWTDQSQGTFEYPYKTMVVTATKK